MNDAVAQSIVAEKLPLEQDHLVALKRMEKLSAYYGWTLKAFESYLGKRVLDAGCGIGNFTHSIASMVDYILAVDLSPENIAILNQRFAQTDNVEVAQIDLDEQVDTVRRKEIDTIVCLDVLEHVENDVQLLNSFHQAIQPGGHLLVKVPACQWLFGSIDEASCHFRRYSRKVLVERAKEAGWEPIRCKYMNIAGVVPYWIKGRLLKRKANFSRTFSDRQIGMINKVIPILRVLDKVTGPLVGQSLTLVAKKAN